MLATVKGYIKTSAYPTYAMMMVSNSFPKRREAFTAFLDANDTLECWTHSNISLNIACLSFELFQIFNNNTASVYYSILYYDDAPSGISIVNASMPLRHDTVPRDIR